MHPDLYRGPAMVKPPVGRSSPGMLRARRRGVETEDWTLDLATWPASGSSRPPNVSGWDDERWLDTSTFRGRWTAANVVVEPEVVDEEAPYDETENAAARRPPRARVLGQPDRLEGHPAGARALRGRGRGRRDRRLAAEHLPGAAPERAAAADRDLPRHADELSDGLQPLPGVHPLAACPTRGRRGRQRAARDRDRDADPGRHRARPALVPAPHPGPRCSRSTAPRGCGSATCGAGSPTRRARTTGCSSRSSSTAGSTRSRCSPRSTTAATGRCARASRSGPARGRRSPRTRACAGTRRRAAFDQLHRRGQGRPCCPAIGYASPDQSHFTSRHYWEVGALDPHAATGWIGRLLDVIGAADNPLQGLSLDGTLSPALATASVPVAALDGPTYDLWSPGVWGEVEDLMCEDDRRASARAQRKDRGLVEAGRRGAAVDARSRPSSSRSRATRSPRRSPTRTATGAGSARTSRRSPRCSTWACRSAAPRSPRPGGYDTHDEPGGDLRRRPDARPPTRSLAFQRDLEARGLDDRVLTLVWSEFGRRPEENDSAAPTTAPPAPAFVIGTNGRGPDGRRVPRPREARRRRQPAQHLRLPRRSTARCSSSGSTSMRPR